MTHLSTSVEIAAELRRRAGLLYPPFSTTKLIETCFPNALVTGGTLPSGVHELVTAHPDGPTILYARSLSVPEQRYAIAHALAHLLFDDESASIRKGSAGIPACERRADRFADHLLAPLHALRAHVNFWPAEGEEHEIYLDQVDTIASRFVVPSRVIDLQIRRLRVTHIFVRQ